MSIGPAASVLDYRELARQRLQHFLFEYVDGCYAVVTLRLNAASTVSVTEINSNSLMNARRHAIQQA
jgi:hypothetical protein